ncbi:NADP-dependent oxidoreductase [Actinophytocola sediminis]
MLAVRYHSYGGPEVLVHEEVDRPVAGPGQVVVRVAGTAFNPTDAGIRAGLLRDVLPLALPHIPNTDVAGVIAEVGEGVTGWRAGDAVIGYLPGTEPGAAAEYVAAPAAALAAAPHSVELADASALPLPGLTAWQALFEHAELLPGQRVLITGAGGAVGGYAVQLAARAGATVTATAGPRSRDRVLANGADRIVDYTAVPVQRAVAGARFDVVLNLAPIGPEEIPRLMDLVVDGGVFVSITTPGLAAGERGVRSVQAFVHSDATQLAGLAALVDAGELRIDVAERLPLTDTAAIHARFAAQLVEQVELVARVDDGVRGARATELARRLRADTDTDTGVGGRLAGKTVFTPT